MTPATNAFYAGCVAAGRCTTPDHDIADPNSLSWDDPSRAELPIYARYEQAEAYCEWAGGRLPSVAELLRAAQGNSEVPGVRALTEASVACFAPGTSSVAIDPALCEKLEAMNFASPTTALRPVGSMALDKGPFEHFDLFGSVWQMTRTYMRDLPNTQFCAIEDGSTDFVSVVPATSGIHMGVQFATRIELSAQLQRWTQPLVVVQSHLTQHVIGFRCAFDSPPQ